MEIYVSFSQIIVTTVTSRWINQKHVTIAIRMVNFSSRISAMLPLASLNHPFLIASYVFFDHFLWCLCIRKHPKNNSNWLPLSCGSDSVLWSRREFATSFIRSSIWIWSRIVSILFNFLDVARINVVCCLITLVSTCCCYLRAICGLYKDDFTLEKINATK